MIRAIAAAGLLAAVATFAAGCGGSHASRPRSHSVDIAGLGRELRKAEVAAVSTAKLSDPSLYRIFPSRRGSRRCRFGGGVMRHLLRGRCSTAVSWEMRVRPFRAGPTHVEFVERWHLGTRRFSSRWLLTIAPSGAVTGTRLTGATPPQFWK